MPTIRLTTIEGNSDEEIQAFMEGVTDLIHDTLGNSREAVIVHVEQLPADRYMRGGVTIEDRLRAAKK